MSTPRALWSATALAALLLIALAPDTYWLYVIAMVGISCLVGVGLNVLTGLSGQVSIGHSGFYLLGAYCAGILTTRYAVNFFIALPAAAALAALVGAALAAPALRVRGPYLAMVTIAFAIVVENVTIEWATLTGGFNGIQNIPKPALADHAFSLRELVFLTAALTALALWLYARLSASQWGHTMRAVRDSEVAAVSIGINPLAVRTLAFALSAALAGVAGALYGALSGFISPESFGFYQSILFLLVTILGGLGSVAGPLLGAATLVLLPELLASFSEYRLLFFGALLLLILWLAPDGIAGVLARRFATPAPNRSATGSTDSSAFLAEGAQPAPLEVCDIEISFGGIKALSALSVSARSGEVTAIIGPNGAGKTTLLNLIGGFYRPRRGAVRVGAMTLSGLAGFAIARAGVGRTFQATQLFSSLSALDNVRLAMLRGRSGSLWRAIANPHGDVRTGQRALDLLGFVGYRGNVDAPARDLPFVDRRLVETARALALRPQVLLLDEPAAGLNREDTGRLGDLVRQVADAGVKTLLVEHDMGLVMRISDRIAVLDAGTLIAHGTPAQVRNDPAVIRAYLGASGAAALGKRAAGEAGSEVVLQVAGLCAGYGRVRVLEDIELDVRRGELVAVIGANGAGKSTLMRALGGLLVPQAGSIRFLGDEICGRPAHALVAAGITMVPEGRQVFPELSVRDNIRLGAYRRKDAAVERDIELMLQRFPRLGERMASRAGLLSGGEQQMLAIARALMAQPKLLLLDEPSLGLAPRLIDELYSTLAKLRGEGVTLLLVDQLAALALAVADRAYVLETGRIVQHGPAAELRHDPAVERAYLGTVH